MVEVPDQTTPAVPSACLLCRADRLVELAGERKGAYERDNVVQQMSLTNRHTRKAFMLDMNDVDVEVIYTVSMIRILRRGCITNASSQGGDSQYEG
jgi:hypothetical protein